MSKKRIFEWPSEIWPEPYDPNCGHNNYDANEITDLGPYHEDIEELLKIKSYLLEKEERDEKERFEKEDGFDDDAWDADITDLLNKTKIAPCKAVPFICEVIDYNFINENLLRQAFTRRAFANENNLSGDSEQLEFYGDSALSTVITRELYKQFTDVDIDTTDAPFQSKLNEGELTRIRTHYVSKEYLSTRALELGLDRFILYGAGEEPGESAREDMMEALIGAVAVDSNWDWDAVAGVVDKLLCPHMNDPYSSLLKETYYNIFNAWHQKRFGCIPVYNVEGGEKVGYRCIMEFHVPENDKGVYPDQELETDWSATRSNAREKAATEAYSFVVNNGLWLRLEDAGITPSLDDSINQLQELYQKKYVDSKPQYSFEERPGDMWVCVCDCDGINGVGKGESKTKAKKKAAYTVLVVLFVAAGLGNDEWMKKMF